MNEEKFIENLLLFVLALLVLMIAATWFRDRAKAHRAKEPVTEVQSLLRPHRAGN